MKLAGGRKTRIRIQDIEQLLSQSSGDEWFRNELLFDLPEVLTKADYLTTEPAIASEINAHHLYRFSAHGRAWYIRLKEIKDTGEIVIERIGDN